MSRLINNKEIARLLRNVAAAYEIKKLDRFRIIAYENAADSISQSSIEVRDLWEQKRLEDLPGIGKSIASHLDELFRTGHVQQFESTFKNLPSGMFPLMEISGIGPKTAYKLAKNLSLIQESSAISKLKKAIENNKIAQIEGFGPDSQQKILNAISEYERREDRMLLPQADQLADQIIAYLKKCSAVIKIEGLGSLRRRKATVQDIDIAVATNEPGKVLQHFIQFSGWKEVLASGENTARAIHRSGRQIDIKTEPLSQFGTMLAHFTGSKEHNVKLREYALAKGYSISEHGIKTLKGLSSHTRGQSLRTTKFKTEKEFYKFLGMEWIPPELREGNDEIETSLRHKLPELVTSDQIKGDFHIHSNINIEPSHDLGSSSLSEITTKAHHLGHEYIVIADHNPSTSLHNPNQIIDLIKKRNEAIDKFISSRENNMKIKIFKSLEIDILPSGELAIPPKGLDLLDFAIISIHSNFRESRQKQTQRILNALNHPKVKILGHPSGRQIQQREGIDVDWSNIFDFCAKRKIWLEINASPLRLDLPDRLIREALKFGIKFTIGTDSHDISQMDFIKYGVDVARRGWCQTQNIINALGYNEVISLI